MPLPEVARAIVSDYLAKERVDVGSSDPMFVVRYRARSGGWRENRMTGQRVWKLIKALGRRAGLPELHPHAFRHGCGVELHRRTGGNPRMVTGFEPVVYMHTGVTVVLGDFSAMSHLEELVSISGAGPLTPELMARVEMVWRSNFGFAGPPPSDRDERIARNSLTGPLSGCT